ncbi:MAG: protein translocase subunit SecF [Dehalococcoidales bacterium]|nr:protein translocase subunit SecF [Dehalococcoidales bacterium]
MTDIVGKRFWFFVTAGIIILFSIISLANFGLKPGIELSSGSMLTVSFEQTVVKSELQEELASAGYSSALIQQTGEGGFLIRTEELSSEEKTALEETLQNRFGATTESEFYSVSPMVASETTRNAGIAIAVAAVGILLYITWAFRKMPKPFRYGVCALMALGHDILISLGVFAVLGGVFGWEVNLMFITGILAVVGYSVNNTVVVFDRIRENLSRRVSTDFKTVVNNSIAETVSRSLNTSLTTLFVILAMILFVGASIQNFAVVMLIGVIAGTFSSVCVAPNLLVVWEEGKWSSLFKRNQQPATKARES